MVSLRERIRSTTSLVNDTIDSLDTLNAVGAVGGVGGIGMVKADSNGRSNPPRQTQFIANEPFSESDEEYL